MKYVRLLLIFIPIAIIAELLHWSPMLIFFMSALAIIPLAGILGNATEVLAEKTGPRIGGLLNASLGNAAELIITLVAIRAGQLALVSASIIGSILGNVLLVMGASIFLGGLRHGIQKFDRAQEAVGKALLAAGNVQVMLFPTCVDVPADVLCDTPVNTDGATSVIATPLVLVMFVPATVTV